ncbi:MAG: zf-TFIIB domain-containing protein [Alphaproteobacteria bacterium]
MPLLMCPNCNVSTQSIQRRGIEIDMCPQCRGVWLDRGELEKILEMEQAGVADAEPSQPPGYAVPRGHPAADRAPDERAYRDRDRDHGRGRDWDDDDHGGRHGRGRRRGFSLMDIFD